MSLRLVTIETLPAPAPEPTPRIDPYAARPNLGPDVRMAGSALMSLARSVNSGVAPGGTFASLKLSIAAAKHILRDLPGLVAAMETEAGKEPRS